jgi:UDP-3-O-[3-hydroxymyristoyl] glucosamine N-acyltransferase
MKIEFTVKQISDLINGTIEGDETAKLKRFDKIEEGDEGGLSFLANPKYNHYLYTTKATACIVKSDFIADQKHTTTLIRVNEPYIAFAKLLEFYNSLKPAKTGISKMVGIAESASIGENCYIGDFVSIGENCTIGNNVQLFPHVVIGDNTQIGDNTTIYAGVKIYDSNIIGKNCTIHAGAVIGADGFGFAPQQNDKFQKVAQIGNVIIEDWVEIGANTCVDRATMGSTIIRKGVKLDNLIQIAHNVEIGNNTVMAALSGVAGSSKVGKNCMIGGQVGISGHIKIADEVKLGAQTGVSNNIATEGAIMLGAPAIDASIFRKSIVVFRKLPELVKRVDALEKK